MLSLFCAICYMLNAATEENVGRVYASESNRNIMR